ncbi:hypothetical protein IFO69_07990 [Echinicola sp. CAU 1574]|uniref:Uncharacterized protein n=1 Tax=Echinicola arenosa TaxID=2774144 RepID=A0ABR9AIZ4_9BACT|nr:hypothetical protein [Echinicola arenosa]MBD8488680.1 hypothetical protein [Echinicola arenosa]
MFKANQILSKSFLAIMFGAIVGAFLSTEADAQEVRDCDRSSQQERSRLEVLEDNGNVNSFEEYKPEKTNPVSKPTVKERKENPIYKASGEKDVKKDEMSTLSFNLFLYIVDRFKED